MLVCWSHYSCSFRGNEMLSADIYSFYVQDDKKDLRWMDCSGLIFPIHPPIKVAMAGPAPWLVLSLQLSLVQPFKLLPEEAREADESGREQEHSIHSPGDNSSLCSRDQWMWTQALIWAFRKKMKEMLFFSKNSGGQTIK